MIRELAVATGFACIVGVVIGVVVHVALAIILTLLVWLALGPVALHVARPDDRLERPPGDPVAYWAVFARAHKTTDLPARALVYEVALRTGVLAWLEERTTPAQREVAFALAPEFDGTIGELLDVARHLEAENTHGSGTPRATRADGPLAGPL